MTRKTVMSALLLGMLFVGNHSWGSTIKSTVSSSTNAKAVEEYIPKAPNYEDSTFWYSVMNDQKGTGADVFYMVSTSGHDWTTEDGRICRYGDAWQKSQRDWMSVEISGVAKYMGDGNNFYAPFYRYTAIETWIEGDQETIRQRESVSIRDMQTAFRHFLAHRDPKRPFILAGFSQGAFGVVELLRSMDEETAKNMVAAYVLGYKVTPDDTLASRNFRAAKSDSDVGVTICINTVKDVKYIKPILSEPNVMCINPVNWRTDSVPAMLHDTITVTMSPSRNVLVVTGYDATEYKPICNTFNIGDIHSCEPWLYSECLRQNMQLRIRKWREKHPESLGR